MKNGHDWHDLIDRHLRGELVDAEKEQLSAWLDSDSSARREFIAHVQWDTRLAEVLRESPVNEAAEFEPLPGGSDGASAREQPSPFQRRMGPIAFYHALLAAAALAIAALAATLSFQSADVEPTIARISGLSGSLIWTGNGGQIVRDLRIGTELSGGTIEGMAPDSWFELQFQDGSTVMIAGASSLTFSDLGQKELRLKEGRISANVVPQPEGRPMLIHTRSAVLKVIGTQFEVEVELTSTVLHVSEGKVQVKRLSDGRMIDVPARHRVVASADEGLSPEPVPDAVHDWKSQLQLGPENTYGKWLPASDGHPAALKTIPFVPQENKSVTLYLLGLKVTRDDRAPVMVLPGSDFVLRGRLTTAADVYFGIGVARPNGEFAGKFLARLPAAEFRDDSDFEVVFHLGDFGLDPCVWDRKDELPDRPDNLLLTCAWCFTHTGGPTGLEVTEVELVPPEQQITESTAR